MSTEENNSCAKILFAHKSNLVNKKKGSGIRIQWSSWNELLSIIVTVCSNKTVYTYV